MVTMLCPSKNVEPRVENWHFVLDIPGQRLFSLRLMTSESTGINLSAHCGVLAQALDTTGTQLYG